MKRAAFLMIFTVITFCFFANGTSQPADRPSMRQELPRPAVQVRIPSLDLRGKSGSSLLDRYIVTIMKQKHIPGLSAAIVRKNNIIWKGAFGYANINKNRLVEEDTLFIICSISKTITGVALMQLYDQGLFDLHDSVNDYLPFQVYNPNHPSEEITFQMLLTHTSSIKDNWSVMPYYPGDSPIPLGVYLEDYLTPGGAYYNPNKNFYTWAPGTKDAYCNIGVALAGYMVEAITGTPLEDYCQQNLFGPLVMNETSYFLSNLNKGHIAIPYYWSGGNYVYIGHYGFSDYPDGQIRTSSPQLITFLSAFWRNRFDDKPPDVFSPSSGAGNPGAGPSPQGPPTGPSAIRKRQTVLPPGFARILEKETACLMTTVQNPQISPVQGLAFHTWTLNGRLLWGHAGGDQGATTEMWYDEETDIGLVVLTNGESYFFDIIEAMFQYAEGY